MTAVQNRLFANMTMLIRSPGNQCLEYRDSEIIGKYKIFVRITSAPVNAFTAWKWYRVEFMTDRTTGGMNLHAAKCVPATATMIMIFWSMYIRLYSWNLTAFRPTGSGYSVPYGLTFMTTRVISSSDFWPSVKWCSSLNTAFKMSPAPASAFCRMISRNRALPIV